MKKTLLIATAAALSISTSASAMPNPASVFCGKMGGKSVTAKLPTGDEVGLCYLPGKKIVEEWTLLRMFNGKKPSRAQNPFAR